MYEDNTIDENFKELAKHKVSLPEIAIITELNPNLESIKDINSVDLYKEIME